MKATDSNIAFLDLVITQDSPLVYYREVDGVNTRLIHFSTILVLINQQGINTERLHKGL